MVELTIFVTICRIVLMKNNGVTTLGYIEEVIDYYYNQKPDTIMPLLLVALAVDNRLGIAYSEQEDARVHLKYDLIQMHPKSWIQQNKVLKKKIEKYNKNVKLIQSKDSEYNAGISIVPSYLAKGLEFDSVMLFNVNDDKYQTTVLDIKLLYVAITRAMSKLDVFYTGKISELMN